MIVKGTRAGGAVAGAPAQKHSAAEYAELNSLIASAAEGTGLRPYGT